MRQDLKEQKQKEAKEKIINAALKTVGEHKISGTRMRMIAENAGISQGHLHYYFSSKQELLMSLLDKIITDFKTERASKLGESKLNWFEKITAFLNQKKRHIKNREMASIFFDFWIQGTIDQEIGARMQMSYKQWGGDIKAVLDEAARAGQINNRYNKMLPYFLISIMEGAEMQLSIDGDKFEIDEYFSSFVEMLKILLKPE